MSGLSVGLTTGILLLLWIQNELSFDKFHKDYQSIYQISSHFNFNGENITWKNVPGPLAVFSKSIPGVRTYVRILSQSDQLLADKERTKVFDGNTIVFADSSFFSMFDFPLLKGSIKSAFPDNNSVVITQSTAKKLFNEEEAVGKIMNFRKNSFTVRAVLKDFPENSSINCDALFPMGFYAQQFTADGGNGDWKTIDEDMGNYSFNSFVKLQPATNPLKIGKTFSVMYDKARNGDSKTSFQLQNLGNIHLIGADGNDAALRMVQIFMIVMVLLLAIASINYVNLSTARSLIRAKEVSIRKIIGAKKSQLFLQFTSETVLLFCFATILSIILISLLMPLYNTVSGKMLSFNLSDLKVWKIIGLTVVSTLIASSIYPALLLSSFKPMEVIKGKLTSGIGLASLRKVLVIFQFSISVILLICTVIMGKQMKFIKNRDLGYDRSYVFSVPLPWEAVGHLDAIKAELKGQAGILNVSTSDAYDISNIGSSTSDLDWEGKPAKDNLIITQLSADKDFIPTMRMKFVEGCNFTGTPADSASYILNETAVKKMGLKAPYVGQQISFHNNKGSITGVVRDFNFQSLKEKIAPLILYTFRNSRDILYVRTIAEHATQAIASVENQYKKYAGDTPFKYTFLDKSFESQYQSDQRSGILFKIFACIAIFISCLGLFGLSTYTAQIKTKEIGIRKVLGASMHTIITLVSKDFLKLVIIAILIASPVAWYVMDKWLQAFAYRTDINWWVFALAGLTALLIAVFTISFQAIKVAIANPVKSLRTE
jgi:ABC-type antimicrobial peptide transport system permease subunit